MNNPVFILLLGYPVWSTVVPKLASSLQKKRQGLCGDLWQREEQCPSPREKAVPPLHCLSPAPSSLACLVCKKMHGVIFFILSQESLKTPRTLLLPCPGLPASSSLLDAAATTLLMAWTCSPHLQPKRS